MTDGMFDALLAHLGNTANVERIARSISVPDAVADGLARFVLLHDVPFNYLVADERLLPQESIRFFHVDYDWLLSLLDGALSMGSVSTVDALLDRQLRPKVYDAALRRSKTLRPASKAPATTGTAMTGFLLRSVVVDGWPTLEVNGYADAEEQTRAPLLRMDCVAPDILLCLFDGVVHHVSLHLPPEGLHFGVEVADATETRFPDARYIKKLRSLAKGTPGAPIDGAAVEVPLRSSKNVIRASALRAAMVKALSDPPPHPPVSITSAEFALEMTQGVDRVSFQPQPK